MATITRRNSLFGLLAFFCLILIYLYHTAPTPEFSTECGSTTSSAIRAHCRQIKNAPVVPLRGKNLRIMCMGDSVTMGPGGTNSYRAELVKGLRGNTINMVGSMNWGTQYPYQLNRLEGGMGKTIEDLTVSMAESLPERRPNVILMHMGTNDVAWKRDLDTAPLRMERAIDRVLEFCPDAAILVSLITPVAFRNDELRNFNNALAQIVAERAAKGHHVLIVDHWRVFEKPGHAQYMADVAHPNEEGYAVMATTWLDSLQKANGLGWIGEPVKVSSE